VAGEERLKLGFEKAWIFLSEPYEVNQYDGSTVIKTISKQELISFLEEFTRYALSKVNTPNSLINGGITDIENHKFKLACYRHQVKQAKLLEGYSASEMKYVETINKWLSNEERFFEKIGGQFPNLGIYPDAFEDISPGVKTFSTRLNEKQLKALYQGLVKNNYINSIGMENFIYLFSNNPITPKMKKATWLKSKKQWHYFLRKAVYEGERFDYGQANMCMVSHDRKPLNSNDKNENGYFPIDRIVEDALKSK